jgi:hypothetical protein
VTRFVLLVVAFVAVSTGAGVARACSLQGGVRYLASRASGPQPRNSGVLATTGTYEAPGPTSGFVSDEAGRAVAVESTPLFFRAPEAISLLREPTLPASGSKRVHGVPLGLPDASRAVAEYGYTAGVQLPAANERAFVSIYETDRNGRDARQLADVIVHPDRPMVEARVAVSGEAGRTACLAFKITDLAGNPTPLGQPCCADEKTASGPCQRIAPPPREYFIPEPEPSGAGCSLSPRSQASAAWAWLAIVIGWFLRARRHRRLARPVAIAVAALLIIGCDSEGEPPTVDAGAEAGRGGADAPANPAALQPIWGPSSQHLEIRCSAFGGATSRFAASREQLTETQLAAVAGLRARPSGKPEICYFDGASCQVEIVVADGGRTTFKAPYESECDASHRLIPWASLEPVLGALDCRLEAGQTGWPMRPNPYCERGLRLPAAEDPWLLVPEPGTYAFELSACGKRDPTAPPGMQVRDEAGAPVLEARVPADPGPGDVCLQAVHQFTQPGLFRLKVTGVSSEDFIRPTLRFTRDITAAP